MVVVDDDVVVLYYLVMVTFLLPGRRCESAESDLTSSDVNSVILWMTHGNQSSG